jgi:methanogenic corrinoid protein MtbC1
MKKGNNYGWTAIMNFAEENNYDMENLGLNVIGMSFIVLTHESKDITVSYVLTGTTGEEYIYECVYTDV